MREISRLIATLLIWVSFTVVMTSSSSPLNSNGLSGGAAVIAIAFLAAAAGGSTLAVWVARPQETTQPPLEKAKRTRVGRFMDSLSDDEIAELRARLMADDAEPVALDDLLHAPEQGRRVNR